MAHFDVLRASSREEKLAAPTVERARAILTPRVLEVIASRARRIKLGLLPNNPLVEKNLFDYGFVIELSEHLPFRIDAATQFFKRLGNELANHLASGGRMHGRWGRLVLEGEKIVFEIGTYEEALRASRRESRSKPM